jgi:hypothetical protein
MKTFSAVNKLATTSFPTGYKTLFVDLISYSYVLAFKSGRSSWRVAYSVITFVRFPTSLELELALVPALLPRGCDKSDAQSRC